MRNGDVNIAIVKLLIEYSYQISPYLWVGHWIYKLAKLAFKYLQAACSKECILKKYVKVVILKKYG